ncbi:TOBE domain-containing protein [Aquimarina latercula]|uniref:TOBE domain-containing protein n=1 Tax=Aquimarina latercula TaxID=987 RepID=UPI000484E653|nr:TOBE domain-containing protein [Aquimarina latercula]
MNVFSGHISDIQVSKNLSMVSIEINEHTKLKTILVETPDTASYLHKGNSVKLLFKETEVIISKDDSSLISIQNKIPATIKKCDSGVLLSKIVLHTAIGDIVAIITTEILNELELKENLAVIVMIKANEIMLSK